MKVLVAGWFSFEEMGASAGDLISRDLVARWLTDAGWDYDLAVAPPFEEGVDWKSVDPPDYTEVVFVCGPFGNGWPIYEFLDRFRHCRLRGINLSMIEPLEAFNPFETLWERDSTRSRRPDAVFGAAPARVPVAGVVLVERQKEYRDKGRHADANVAIQRLVDTHSLAVVPIDTRLDINTTGLLTAAAVESVIARMDLVLTTRLHGMVLALKHGVPALAIDPIAGGAKIKAQAETIGWPCVFTADALEQEALDRGLAYCLSDEARSAARACCRNAVTVIDTVRDEFLAALARAAEKGDG